MGQTRQTLVEKQPPDREGKESQNDVQDNAEAKSPGESTGNFSAFFIFD
jgi:hypothetical protein